MLGYSFFAMLECEIWLEPKLRARRYTRYIGSVAIIGFAIWFTLSVVFHQAPLHFSATSYSDEHADGVVSDGITWNSRMAELRITIENPSNEGMRQRDYRVDRGGSLDYRRAAAQAVGVSSERR